MSDAAKSLPVVYVVDDETLICQTLAMILKTSGFRALAFDHPIEALRSAETIAPSLLITDVMMPQMNGIDLAIRVRTLCPDCKVLLFSGVAATSALLETARAQGHHFHILGKPVHPAELLAAIGKL